MHESVLIDQEQTIEWTDEDLRRTLSWTKYRVLVLLARMFRRHSSAFHVFRLGHVAMVRTHPVEGRTFQHFNSSCIQTSIG